MRRVLLDGWPMLAPGARLQALHLLGLLAHHPVEVELILALPASRPAWLPGNIDSVSGAESDLPSTDSPMPHLNWEQRQFPALARQVRADGLHAFSQSAPYFTNLPVTLSSSSISQERIRHGVAANLRTALAAGGAARARAALWPADLAAPAGTSNPVSCAPVFDLDGSDGEAPFDLPETFVLYNGTGREETLRRLVAAWRWCAPSVGDQVPLLAVDLPPAAAELLLRLATEFRVADSVQVLPVVSPYDLVNVYKRASVLFHPAEIAPWDDPILLALACGKAIAAADTPAAQQRVGPAAYLAEMNNPRALGAALLTILVEERVAQGLEDSARERSRAWAIPSLAATLSALWADED